MPVLGAKNRNFTFTFKFSQDRIESFLGMSLSLPKTPALRLLSSSKVQTLFDQCRAKPSSSPTWPRKTLNCSRVLDNYSVECRPIPQLSSDDMCVKATMAVMMALR